MQCTTAKKQSDIYDITDGDGDRTNRPAMGGQRMNSSMLFHNAEFPRGHYWGQVSCYFKYDKTRAAHIEHVLLGREHNGQGWNNPPDWTHTKRNGGAGAEGESQDLPRCRSLHRTSYLMSEPPLVVLNPPPSPPDMTLVHAVFPTAV